MPTDYERRLIRVLDYIHAHPAEDLSLDALATVAALSRFHFHRVFRALTGETVAAMVRRIRMDRAAVLLTHGRRPIAEIAGAVGYPNVASFTRAFTECQGLSPGAYRRRGEYRTSLAHVQAGDRPMTHPVTLRDAPARRLAAVLHRGAYPLVGQAFDRLWTLLSARGLAGRAGGMAAVFYDDPSAVAEADLRSHAGVFIDGDIALAAPLEDIRLVAGRFAVMRYTGPYSGLSAAYDAFYCNWLPGSGEEPGDAPAFEVYLNSPADAAPDALITEMWMPLK